MLSRIQQSSPHRTAAPNESKGCRAPLSTVAAPMDWGACRAPYPPSQGARPTLRAVGGRAGPEEAPEAAVWHAADRPDVVESCAARGARSPFGTHQASTAIVDPPVPPEGWRGR